jgi:predicted phage terminase large subunit-like protein
MLDLAYELPSLPPSQRPLVDVALEAFANTLEEDVQVAINTGPDLTFMQFIEGAWPILEPDRPFINNWHIGAKAEHLHAVHLGQILKLLINEPPGCSKSRVVSVMFNAWEWTKFAHLRYLCASYDQTLSTRDNIAVRDLVESEWYQDRWPHVQLKTDDNQKTKFSTTRGGWRIGTSVAGRGTGEHPHRKIFDDLHNAKKAESAKDRETVRNWRTRTMGLRGKLLRAAEIVIMQRLHEEDTSGDIISSDIYQTEWVHLCLPMRFDPGRRCVTFGSMKAYVREDAETGKPKVHYDEPSRWVDPRTEDGELLWPQVITEAEVEKVEAEDPYTYAGQMQQQPAPETGGLFERGWFQIVDAIPAQANVLARTRGWDAAGTDEQEAIKKKRKAAYTAGCRMSICYDGRIYLEDMIRERVGPGDDDKLMKQTADLDGHSVRIREEQEPGSSGKKIIAAHGKVLVGYDFEGVAATGDKVTKARPFRAQCKLGNVFLVRGTWNKAFLDEACLFPNGTYKDQIDAAAIAFNDIALDENSAVVVKTGGH